MNVTKEEPKDGSEFGAYLRELRRARRLTLREVEEACGVSNSYLSQLEHGSIRQPRPNVLQKLSSVYGVPYDNLMARAGYIGAGAGGTPAGINETSGEYAADGAATGAGRSAGWAFSIPNDLSTEEELELQSFLDYLKFKRQGR